MNSAPFQRATMTIGELTCHRDREEWTGNLACPHGRARTLI
jgi:hypothetical protein